MAPTPHHAMLRHRICLRVFAKWGKFSKKYSIYTYEWVCVSVRKSRFAKGGCSFCIVGNCVYLPASICRCTNVKYELYFVFASHTYSYKTTEKKRRINLFDERMMTTVFAIRLCGYREPEIDEVFFSPLCVCSFCLERRRKRNKVRCICKYIEKVSLKWY